jgi:hypothetical protein
MRYIKTFLFIISVSATQQNISAMIAFAGPLPPFGAAAPGVLIGIGPGIAAVAPIDIDIWDATLPSNAANNILPANAFGGVGVVIPNGNVVHEMFHYFRNFDNKPHVALMRIVIIGANGNRYIYPVQQVFVSGIFGSFGLAGAATATTRWNNHNHIGIYPNLNNALNNIAFAAARPIDNLVKGIGDYGFGCQQPGQPAFYAHSERAAILCLLYSIAPDSIEDAVVAFNGTAPLIGIAQIVIQMKIAFAVGTCVANCQPFLNNLSMVDNGCILPSAFGVGGRINRGTIPPALCLFGGANFGNVIFNTRAYLAAKSGIAAVNIHLRVSHIPGAIPLAIPGAPLATLVNGF